MAVIATDLRAYLQDGSYCWNHKVSQKEFDCSSIVSWVDMVQMNVDDGNPPAVTGIIKFGRFGTVGQTGQPGVK